MIKKRNGKYVIVSKKGKTLGTFGTRESAERRLGQIEYFKHKK